MSLIELFLLAVGLAMDAFSVAICKGLALRRITWKNAAAVGVWFGGFQALMPLMGWWLGERFAAHIARYDHWVIFVLLSLIGGNMIREALQSGEDQENESAALSPRAMLPLAVATSIDALAVGVIVTSMTSGMNVDVYNYMFGSILAMSSSDVYISVGLSVVVLVLFMLFYPRIFAVTFDEAFARATGVKAGTYNMLIALLTAMTVVVGMRMMGTLLISSLIIFPALSSMRLFSHFRAVTICSAIVSVGCFLLGMMLSCVYSLPTGAGIVAVNLVVFIAFSAIGAIRQ